MMKTMILCVHLFSNNAENLIALLKANAGQDEAELGQLLVRIFCSSQAAFSERKKEVSAR